MVSRRMQIYQLTDAAALAGSADAFFTKPVRVESLLAARDQLLARTPGEGCWNGFFNVSYDPSVRPI